MDVNRSYTTPRAISALLALGVLGSCSMWRSSPNQEPASPELAAKARPVAKSAKEGPSENKSLHSNLSQVSKVLGLTSKQLDKLQQDGLVVMQSPRNFGSVPSPIYDQIYQHDLPVFITSDSILYAFHRRYVEFLADLESKQLSALLARVISKTRNELQILVKDQRLVTQQAVELDVYLTVALNLLQGPTPPLLKATPRARIKQAIKLVRIEKFNDLKIFGRTLKQFDFSQFKPRGHYRRRKELRRYFRAVMWLSRVQLKLIDYPDQRPKLDRLGFETAATLSWLIQKSGAKQELSEYLGILDDFVGPADDDNPLSMGSFLKTHQITKASDIKGVSNQQIIAWLAQHQDQRSRILSHVHVNQNQPANSKIPRSFMMIGQRFTLDSYLLGNLVYDRLTDPKHPKVPIRRMMPKALDIMAVLGNPRAKHHLKDEFKRYNYEGALDIMARQVKDKPRSFWTSNLHSAWLDAIASLHHNTSDPRLPAVFRSTAWQDKTLQTQLASWAELRHDHILYVKQSYTSVIGCEFPDAYVEPVPHVFAKIKRLVSKLHAVTDRLETRGLRVEKEVHDELIHFSTVLDQLHSIADKELRHEPPSSEEKAFLKKAVESEAMGYGEVRWDGWYPKLLGEKPTDDFEPTIADVHTDPPGQHNNYTARVLHVGTGKFELATIALDCPGQKKCVYVGPVSSFYEFIPDKGQRLSDEEWQSMFFDPLIKKERPEWIESFRVPTPPTQQELEQIKYLIQSKKEEEAYLKEHPESEDDDMDLEAERHKNDQDDDFGSD